MEQIDQSSPRSVSRTARVSTGAPARSQENQSSEVCERAARRQRKARMSQQCRNAGSECDSADSGWGGGGQGSWRGVGQIQCGLASAVMRSRLCGATVVSGMQGVGGRGVGWSLSVGSPCGIGVCWGPSACVTAPPPLSRLPPARPRLSASAAERSRASIERD